MAAVLAAILNIAETALGGYASYYSIISIRKLREYEDMSKKAANYSRTAEERLWGTRYTQGAGAVTIVISLLSSSYATYRSIAKVSSEHADFSIPAGLALALLNAALTLMARQYIAGFWEGKAKMPLPGSGDYNDAISTTHVMKSCLRVLTVMWALNAVLEGRG